MKKPRLNTREDIENEFLSLTEKQEYNFLCWLFKNTQIEKEWKSFWRKQKFALIEDYFFYEQDSEELTYLTRCLTLHMMLDDNEDLLE